MSIDPNELLTLVARAMALADPVRMPVAVISHAMGLDCTDGVRDGLIALARCGWVSLQTDPLTGHIDSVTLTPQGHTIAARVLADRILADRPDADRTDADHATAARG